MSGWLILSTDNVFIMIFLVNDLYIITEYLKNHCSNDVTMPDF